MEHTAAYKARSTATSRGATTYSRFNLKKAGTAPRLKKSAAELSGISSKAVIALAVLGVLTVLAAVLQELLFPNGVDAASLSTMLTQWGHDVMAWTATSSSPAAQEVLRCSSSAADSPFQQTTQQMTQLINGSMTKVLGLGMLVVGMGLGVVKNSPMPALTAVAGASVMNFGPSIIMGMMGC